MKIKIKIFINTTQLVHYEDEQTARFEKTFFINMDDKEWNSMSSKEQDQLCREHVYAHIDYNYMTDF